MLYIMLLVLLLCGCFPKTKQLKYDTLVLVHNQVEAEIDELDDDKNIITAVTMSRRGHDEKINTTCANSSASSMQPADATII